MKITALLFALLTTLSLSAQSLKAIISFQERKPRPGSDTLYYDKALDWSLFQGVPESNGKVAALTSSGFGFEAGMLYKEGRGTLELNVYCFFNKTKSWVKPDRTTSYILNHEQRHFDISYISTLRFIQQLRSLKFTRSNYDDLLDQAYTDSYTYMNNLQAQYDQETNNGIDRNKQSEWNAKISALLGTMKAELRIP